MAIKGMAEKNPLLIAHLADLHLAPRAATIAKIDPSTGRRVRDLDMSLAFDNAVSNILEQEPLPAVCVIAGDIFDTYQGSHSALLDAERAIKRLRDAGVAVVGIAGNHDTPTQALKMPAFKVLTDTFENIVGDDGVVLAYDSIKKAIIGDVEYVLLPHSCCLHEIDVETLRPSGTASRNVLVVHGVAAGDPSLQQHDEMKEVPIKRSILDMGWDYIAFGHYHKPGWIPGYEGTAAYSGSLENTVISGPDVCMRRGPVYIDLSGDTARLEMKPLPIRSIIDLGDIDYDEIVHEKQDASGVDAIDDAVVRQILDANTDHAIVLNRVTNIPRSVYRSMTRRSFQSVNPRMLFIRTKFEMREAPSPVIDSNQPYIEPCDDNNDEEITSELDIASHEMLPLAQESKRMVDTLIARDVIKEDNRDAVVDLLEEYFSSGQN